MSIFISYKRVDKQRVFEIKRLIEENTGQSCWIDIDGIESDAQFVSVIMSAINECELFLFMYSKAHSEITDFERDWTVREIMFAQKKKKRIVFVNIDGAELADWFEFMFGTKQQVSALDYAAVEHLCSDIIKWLGNCPDEQDIEEWKNYVPYIQNGKCGFMDDKTGREVVSCKYDNVSSFSEGLAWVRLNGKYGFIDKAGREVIPCKYDYAESFSEGLAWVGCNDKYGFIDKAGREVLPCEYDDARPFSEGLAVVVLNGKWGFVDKAGREVVPFKYDGASHFSEGLARVELNGKYGFVDKAGCEVIPCEYDDAYDFRGGTARVNLNGESGYVDKFGNCTLDK